MLSRFSLCTVTVYYLNDRLEKARNREITHWNDKERMSNCAIGKICTRDDQTIQVDLF